MAIYPIIAKVHFWDEISNTLDVRFHPLYAHSLAAATTIVEDYYKSTLDSVEVRYVDAEDKLFEIPEDLANHYISEGVTY